MIYRIPLHDRSLPENPTFGQVARHRVEERLLQEAGDTTALVQERYQHALTYDQRSFDKDRRPGSVQKTAGDANLQGWATGLAFWSSQLAIWGGLVGGVAGLAIAGGVGVVASLLASTLEYRANGNSDIVSIKATSSGEVEEFTMVEKTTWDHRMRYGMRKEGDVTTFHTSWGVDRKSATYHGSDTLIVKDPPLKPGELLDFSHPDPGDYSLVGLAPIRPSPNPPTTNEELRERQAEDRVRRMLEDSREAVESFADRLRAKDQTEEDFSAEPGTIVIHQGVDREGLNGEFASDGSFLGLHMSKDRDGRVDQVLRGYHRDEPTTVYYDGDFMFQVNEESGLIAMLEKQS